MIHGLYRERVMPEEALEEKTKLHISVRNLVEFIFREGDIDNRHGAAASPDAMQEGTRIHQKIQRSMGAAYRAEVPLKFLYVTPLYELTVDGRADGIFVEAGTRQVAENKTEPTEIRTPQDMENETEAALAEMGTWQVAENEVAQAAPTESVWIDEIKGIYRKLDLLEEPYYVHKAQAMCYAYIFARDNELKQIGVQMTYCCLDDEEIRRFREVFSFEELEAWFEKLMNEYRKWADFQCLWRQKRQASIHKLQFPFPYRDGQKKLLGDVYRSIAQEKILFIQAPTGTGKTVTTIFPAVKAVGEELAERIFYLTAKTVTAAVAKETFSLFYGQGYQAKTIQLTAKEKLCLCEEMDCNPQNCPYAKGHFDRVNDAVYDLLQKSDLFTREEILQQAQDFTVCPFEMSLDVATWADNIICDYNYVFDPHVYLKRFFQEGVRGEYIFLVDEAHNLVERGRNMYSAELYKEDFLTVKKLLKPFSKGLERLLEQCNKILLDYKRECEEYCVYEHVSNLIMPLMRLAGALNEFLQKGIEIPERKTVTDFYFNLRTFLETYERVGEHYVIYTQHAEDGRFVMKLFCVDPSRELQERMDKGIAAVLFSATLLPIHYYKSLLSTREDNYAIYAESSFSQEQRLLLFARDVSTKYTRRNAQEFEKIAAYIRETVACKTGNYMVFFPSYKLMEQVYEQMGEAAELVLMQKSRMREQEREAFLEAFEEERSESLIGFCVMGGIFGEGIDLKRDALIGAIVVGTGLPQVSCERELLKKYYDEKSGNGFDFAYRYPGLNKVLQAAGRVIRTNEDRGVIVLLDERFLQSDYDALYPREWSDRKICSLDTVQSFLQGFWQVT